MISTAQLVDRFRSDLSRNGEIEEELMFLVTDYVAQRSRIAKNVLQAALRLFYPDVDFSDINIVVFFEEEMVQYRIYGRTDDFHSTLEIRSEFLPLDKDTIRNLVSNNELGVEFYWMLFRDGEEVRQNYRYTFLDALDAITKQDLEQ